MNELDPCSVELRRLREENAALVLDATLYRWILSNPGTAGNLCTDCDMDGATRDDLHTALSDAMVRAAA